MRKPKSFLKKQLAEYETKNKKFKKKRKIIKSLFTSIIVISFSSSAICATLAPFTVPVFIIPILSTTACITTALSTKFNLTGRKAELNQTIKQLNKIQEGPISQTNRAATWANSGKNRPRGLSAVRKAYI